MDAFYVGKLKGIGPVWQLTAADTRTRSTIAELYLGRPNSQIAATFLDVVIDRFAAIRVDLTGVIVDGGPEWKAAFRRRATDHDITVNQTPPRSPNHGNWMTGRTPHQVLRPRRGKVGESPGFAGVGVPGAKRSPNLGTFRRNLT